MKKLFFTGIFALATLFASSQIMVVTSYDGDQEETIDKLTANMGIGFSVNDNFTIGFMKAGENDEGDDSYDLWVRYNLDMMEGGYVSLQMPTSDGTDNMSIGLGMAVNVSGGLYLEPNYSMSVSEDDDGDREGTFNLGLSYRF